MRTNPEFSLIPGAIGSYSWGGYWGTYFRIDPVERLAVVELVQVPPYADANYRDAVRHLTYPALSVPQPPLPTVAVPSETLARFAGTYDFGSSLSAHDRRAPIPAFAFSGVGLEIAVSDKVTVLRPTDNGPAAKAGVTAGDVITEIDGTPVNGLTLDPVLAKLRGAPGTSVRLKLADKEVTVVREAIRPRAPGSRSRSWTAPCQLRQSASGQCSISRRASRLG